MIVINTLKNLLQIYVTNIDEFSAPESKKQAYNLLVIITENINS